MNRTLLCLLLAGAVGLLSGCAAAPPAPEQWLEYRSAARPTYGLYAVEELRADAGPPQGVALPAFKTHQPVFFRWPLGKAVAPSGVLKDGALCMALDRSRPDGPYDLLYLDQNLDGRLAGETAVPATTADRDSDEQARFELVKILLPGKDGPTAYHVNVTVRKAQGQTRLRLQSAGWYEGSVTIGGDEFWCMLIDANVNGQFNDSTPDPYKGDVMRLGPVGGATLWNPATDDTVRAVGRHVEVAGRLYLVDIAPDGASVRFSPARKPPMGRIRVSAEVAQLSVAGAEGHFYCEPKDGLAEVPAGDYVMFRWRMDRTDKDGVRWQLIALSMPPAQPLSVRRGKAVQLDVGEPVAAKVNISSEGADYTVQPPSLVGRAGERVTLLCGDSPARAEGVRIRSADGSYDEVMKFQYG